jgi:hypothetical protein
VALDRNAAQDEPDPATMLALARHRDQLADRNKHTPAHLPAVWAALGRLSRAEAVAWSITNLDVQAIALAKIAELLARSGRHQDAEAIAAQAEAIARSITSPDS